MLAPALLSEQHPSRAGLFGVVPHIFQFELAERTPACRDLKRIADFVLNPEPVKKIRERGRAVHLLWVDLWVADFCLILCKPMKKNGGDDETRTRDLCRDRAAF